MDLYKIAQKFRQEEACDEQLALHVAQGLLNVQPELLPVVEAWLQGNLIGFEAGGVSLDNIMEKENSIYIRAVLSMDLLLQNPNYLASYNQFHFFHDNVVNRYD